MFSMGVGFGPFPVHHLLMLNFLLIYVHRAFCASGMVYVYSTTFRTGRSKPKALTNLCVSWMKSLFFLGSFVTDLWCLNPYWAIRLTTLLVDCMRKDRLPSDVYVDLTCKFGDHGLVSPVRGRLIGGILNFDSDALIWIRTPIPFVDPSLLPH